MPATVAAAVIVAANAVVGQAADAAAAVAQVAAASMTAAMATVAVCARWLRSVSAVLQRSVGCCTVHGGHGHMRPGSIEAYADGGAMTGMATSQIAFLGDEGVQVTLGRQRLRHVRFRAAGDSRPTGFLSRRDLSPEADEHSGPAGRRVVSHARNRAGHAADRCLPGPLADSGAVHGRRFRPGAERQLCDESDLPARSRVPGAGAGRRGNAGEHAARSGCRSDRRGRSPRLDPGDRSHGQQGFGSRLRGSTYENRTGRAGTAT